MSEPRRDLTPHTDEELAAVTIGERTPLNAPITLSSYDPDWPRLYEDQAARIRAALGERVIRLEHVGSTSVPGLMAKPIIDINLEVADSAREDAYVADLEAAGFVLRIREPDWNQHRLFKRAEPAANLHVFSAGCPETRRVLAFRDHLRACEADRRLYEAAKRALAAQTWKHVQNYADAKTTVVEDILTRALGPS